MVINEVDVGYKVTVGKVFDASGTADESGEFVVHPEPDSYVKANTQYLVTLDVNGVNKLYRELWTSGDLDDNPEVALSDYTYITDEERIAGLSEDDAVVVRFEEVEVKTSDAFRAAVSKTAPEAPSELPAVAAADKGKFLHANESTGAVEWAEGGGGVLVVTDIGGMLDKTWQEIHDAPFATLVMSDETVYVLDSRYELNGTYVVCFYNSTGSETREYHATSASRHPSVPNSEA